MNKIIQKVFCEPKIDRFIEKVKQSFSNEDKSKSSNVTTIYLVSFKKKSNNELPKHIYKFYESEDHIDGEIIYLPKDKNNIKDCIVLYGKDKYNTINKSLGSFISSKIKAGSWKLFNKLQYKQAYQFYLGWGLDQYKFNSTEIIKSIELPNSLRKSNFISILSGIFYGKELINIPSSDMGPNDLELSFINFSEYHDASFKIIKGSIIQKYFPLIEAVGKGSTQEPRLLELNWGDSRYPLIVLVGKGVCFDTGGYDLKPSQYMRNMKKDMGGAASVLALANIIIESNLKINLKVLIPTVNNDIGPTSMRPGDIYRSRSGITVEIGNTDAEGRLILADTLHYANKTNPKLIIDYATLTGAARVALGPDIPVYFTNSEEIASLINTVGAYEDDSLWRLPLWKPYESMLNSDFADTNNISNGPFAGSIIAALFLNKFVKPQTNWVHIDTYAWNDKNKPGHTHGGEIMGVLTIFNVIKKYINNL